MVENIKTIGQIYDEVAQSFYEMREAFTTEKKYIDMFVEKVVNGGLVLDLGCGCGTPIDVYLVNKGFDVVGLDDSEAMLVLAAHHIPEMRVLWADMRDAQFEPEFDGIIEWWSLFHLPIEEQKKVIQNSHGWLVKGGVFQFTTGSYAYEESSNVMLGVELPYYSASREEYELLLEEIGYNKVFCESDQEGHLVWMVEKV